MLILCPSCATSYDVEPGSLGAGGRSVRCVSCRTVWFAAPPEAALPKATTRVAEAVAEAEAAFATLPDEPDLAPPEEPEEAPADSLEAGSEDAAPDTDLDLPPPADSPVAESTDGADASGASEPETIADAPPLVPADLDHGAVPAPAAEEPAGSDIESFAARQARRLARQRRRSPIAGLPAAILILLAVNTILLGWRGEVVRLMPQTASLYAAIGLPVNLRGLTFANVKTTKETHDGVLVLAVEGVITSAASKAVEVPRLRFAVRDDAGHEVYAWTALPSRGVLRPGETLPFRSRLASPPAEARDVLVRFFNRRDMIAGIQ